MTQSALKDVQSFQLTAVNTQPIIQQAPTDNLHTLIKNIIVYERLASKNLQQHEVQELKDFLNSQVKNLWYQDKLDQLKVEYQNQEQPEQVLMTQFQRRLYQIEDDFRESFDRQMDKYVLFLQKVINSEDIREQILKGSKLHIQSPDMSLKANEGSVKANEGSVKANKSSDKGSKLSNIDNGLSDKAVQLSENPNDQLSGTSQIDIPANHYFLQKINTNIDYPTEVFNYVKPINHQYYITEAAKTYNQIAPYKLKTIALSHTEGPVINRPNFFQEGIDQAKAILHCCIPGTNKVAFYSMADACREATIHKGYYQQRLLSNQWTFSEYTKSVITTSGKIFAINCRTTKDKIDPYLYEVTDTKASNRGPLMVPKRDAALCYMGGYIYLIGGRGQGEKCSRKNYKYSIKQKKWSAVYQSNISLIKPTVCTVNNRYICKIGGLNEFDYINKTIQLYDSLTDRWSLARCSPRNILEEISILQDSLALQINDDQVYVFGGKNGNKFSTDTGFVLIISEIKEKRKGAAKVSGEFWNVSIGKRNILTFFGTFTSTIPMIQHNVIYGLRTQVCKSLSI